MNLIPKEASRCDFSRIKSWYLDGDAKFLRQTIILSEFVTPELNSLFNKHLLNVRGKLKCVQKVRKGTISKVYSDVPQVFQRISCSISSTVNDQMFNAFTSEIMPQLATSIKKHTVIFISHYFDYVRVRNWFNAQNYNFTSLSEYCSPSDISRARTAFFNGEIDFLLVTERFHFFRRFQLFFLKIIIIILDITLEEFIM